MDAHTHLVFAGDRVGEFEQRLQGASYLEIMAAGGGIMSTVRATREATEEQLAQESGARLRQMLAHGTTTAEAKSGYGLSRRDERRALEAIARISAGQAVELVPTLLAAHSLPPELEGRREEYVERVVKEIVPACAPLARFCDVFCDPAAFTPEESRRVLEAGIRLAWIGNRSFSFEYRRISRSTMSNWSGQMWNSSPRRAHSRPTNFSISRSYCIERWNEKSVGGPLSPYRRPRWASSPAAMMQTALPSARLAKLR